jgi:hypothetical protein
MPCYAVREVTQVLENIPDLNLLARGLEFMGFKVRVLGSTVAFSGVNTFTGQWTEGSYAAGKLKTESGLDLKVLSQCVAKANIMKQVEDNNADKYSATKLTITWSSLTEFTLTKS